jgi:diguanylate cyclase (GGDEF)-like protein
MEAVLRPGSWLMQRLRLAGKLGTVAVVLLVPLAISIAGGYQQSSHQIAFAEHERSGLRYLRPVVELGSQVSLARSRALDGHEVTAADLPGVEDVDAVDLELGQALGVSGQWHRTRTLIRAAFTQDATPRLDHVELLRRAALALQHLVEAVADSSNLVLDSELDSTYVVVTLVQRVPALVETALEGRRLSSTAEVGVPQAVARRRLDDDATALGADLRRAWLVTHWATLRERTEPPARALDAAARQLMDDLEPGAGGQVDAAPLITAAGALSVALERSLDSLLEQRQADLRSQQRAPLVLTLVALAVAGYLFAAMFRVTTRSVAVLLDDIGMVTSGPLHQSEPLPGQDEFAQMSRAVVFARDQLTGMLGTLRYRSTHDDLTSLGNRTLLVEKLEEALGPNRSGTVAVAVIEVGGFRDIGDSFGHVIGDQLIRTLGARLHRAARRRDVVARIGTDEFAVLLAGIADEEEAAAVVGDLLAPMAEPVVVGGRRLRVRLAAGIVLGRGGRDVAADVLRNADVAVYAAAHDGNERPVVFEPRMQDRRRERTELSADLVQAVEREEFTLVYQPLVDLATGAVHGLESLVRWEHPTRGPVPPDVFVPLAEATGLIHPIGRWVLRRSAEQLVAWHRQFPDARPLTMDVNLSPAQLTDDVLVEDLLAVVEETGVSPAHLVLEITESSLSGDTDAVMRRLRRLAAIGVTLALDDFGTGYSSLSHLRRMPVSILKIDKSFVSGVVDPAGHGTALLSSIVHLGAALGMQTVAEGVETTAQAQLLRGLGCHLGQGFLYARALPAEEITRLLEAWEATPAATGSC